MSESTRAQDQYKQQRRDYKAQIAQMISVSEGFDVDKAPLIPARSPVDRSDLDLEQEDGEPVE